MKPNAHLLKQGCPKCGYEKNALKKRLGVNEILNRFNKIFNGLYKYNLKDFQYKNIEQKIPIFCKKHGVFYKTIHQHLQGQGCPMCNSSNMESEIRLLLSNNNIIAEEQKMFEWLKYIGNLRLDFYLPEYNIAIECQGEQHFKPIEWYGGEEMLNYQKERDNIKKKLCEEHNIKIIYYSNKKFDENIITSKKLLLKNILNKNE